MTVKKARGIVVMFDGLQLQITRSKKKVPFVLFALDLELDRQRREREGDKKKGLRQEGRFSNSDIQILGGNVPQEAKQVPRLR